MRNPKWTREELILALDLYFRHNPRTISKNHEEVTELSKILNSLTVHIERPNKEGFRNNNGVYMKLTNFLRFDPDYDGVGMSNGGKLEKEIWEEFYSDKSSLREKAEEIIGGVSKLEKQDSYKRESLGITREKEYIVLISIADIGGNGTKEVVLDNIAKNEYMILDEDDIKLKQNRREIKWRNDLAFTRKGLQIAGYIDGAIRNNWEITEDGLKYLYKLAKKIANSSLKLNKLTEKAIDRAVEYSELIKEKELECSVRELGDEELNTEYKRFVKMRIGQGTFKNKLLRKAPYCKVCRMSEESLLIASHIKPWSESSDKERLDKNNGLLLCPNHDALFDKGYISFEESGEVIISNKLDASNFEKLDINSDIKLDLSDENKFYMNWHKDNVFKK